ncbi:Acg family FMN-binding oxidoreductase [Kocuria sp. M4R2S49]|uniref:Acg family FMN-binding oxidoreductase n=1 Tax=Kocuria rhizosphaericola TaxID=3376284 RepID=UPI0037A48125
MDPWTRATTGSNETSGGPMDVGRSLPRNLFAAVRMAGHVLTGPLLRRRRMSWGAVPEEVSSAWPGDELLPDPSWTATHAVTVEAPPERIWPWLAQLGQGRGGLYSFERLENLIGCRMRNTDRILPEHQDLSAVPEIRLAPQAALAVARVEPGRDLVLAASAGPPAADRRVTGGLWSFHLRPAPEGGTRLVERLSFSAGPSRQERLFTSPALIEPVSFVMSQEMLRNLKRLAERRAGPVPDRRQPDRAGSSCAGARRRGRSAREYDETAAALRRPDPDAAQDRELIRLATLAASSHNTQPWTFTVAPDSITLRPDRSRRCPVVDPDDAHLYKSLGCAAENLVHAAAAQGRAAEVALATDERVVVALDAPGTATATPLSAAIETRQCTRGAYAGRPVDREDLVVLERAGGLGRVRCLLLTEPRDLAAVAEHVASGDLAQLNDAAFRRELVSWIRFNPAAALRSRDGLAGRATGRPPVPSRMGTLLARFLLRAGAQARADAEQLKGSAGVAVFVTADDDRAAWVEAGRACQRFALQAEALDIRTAFVNQPIEVPELRPRFETWLGLAGEHGQLAVRFGHGPRLPYSLRRPIEDVLADPPGSRATRGTAVRP